MKVEKMSVDDKDTLDRDFLFQWALDDLIRIKAWKWINHIINNFIASNFPESTIHDFILGLSLFTLTRPIKDKLSANRDTLLNTFKERLAVTDVFDKEERAMLIKDSEYL